MMEGQGLISHRSHRGKTISCIEYSRFAGQPRAEQKENTLAMVRMVKESAKKYAPGSVLSLVNVTDLYFDMEVINAFKDSIVSTLPYHKKMAIVGVEGIIKAAYNFVVGLGPNTKIRTFSSEQEALDWLASD